jgi:hypothetical protein
VVSPENTRSYNSDSVRLIFVVRGSNWNRYGLLKIAWVGYSLDEKEKVAFVGENETVPNVNDLITRFSTELTDISTGNHSLTVYVQGEGVYSLEAGKAIDYVESCFSAKIFFETNNLEALPASLPNASLQHSLLLSAGPPLPTLKQSQLHNQSPSTTVTPAPSTTNDSLDSQTSSNTTSNSPFFLGISIVTAIMGSLALAEAIFRIRKIKQ